jgi:hypothetical protein
VHTRPSERLPAVSLPSVLPAYRTKRNVRFVASRGRCITGLLPLFSSQSYVYGMPLVSPTRDCGREACPIVRVADVANSNVVIRS